MSLTLTHVVVVAVSAATTGSIEVTSVGECVGGPEVVVAVDGVGGLDPAEAVRVAVTEAPVEAGGDPLLVDVDIALLDAPPLHRVVPLRHIECVDVPDLVAVLLANHRLAHPRQETPPPAPAAPLERVVVVEKREPRLPNADVRFNPLDFGRLDIDSSLNCSGPPGSCGDAPAALSVSVGAALPLALRAQVDGGVPLSKSVALLVAADGIVNKSAGAYAGAAYRVYHADGDIELSIRGLAGVGGSRRSVPNQVVDEECVPAAELDARAAGSLPKNTFNIGNVTAQMYVAPMLSARMRLRWLFVEAGGYWHLGVDDAPGMYLSFGAAIFGG